MRKSISNVLSNYFYLLLLQLGNYVVPLVLMPFLVIKLGVYHFGLLSLALAVNMFLRASTSYGFDLTGVKDVRECLNKGLDISSTFCEIVSAKVLIFIISVIVVIFLVPIVNSSVEFYQLCVLYMAVVFGEALFPVWFYQGMQDMKSVTILKLLSRFCYVAICILMINDPDDIYIVPLSEGICSVIIGGLSIWIACKRHGIYLALPTVHSIKMKLVLSWDVFISKIAVLFYTSFNTIVLGFIAGPSVVGFYSIAERIYMALRELLNPIIQALYPFLVDKHSQSRHMFNVYSKRIFLSLLILMSLIAIFLFSIKDLVLSLLTKDNIGVTREVLMIFCLCLPFSLGAYFSTLLVISNKARILSKITFLTMIVNLALVVPFTYFAGAIGLAICFLIVQVFHFIMQIYYNREVLK
ncbi:oligosaccharide flippase family protein [Aeromonas caviae]|uniref:oligosaccharide flippase family protein n=1 Tax=Aeromonas caviae TaxID=648 RepID=UPI002B4A6110|nr:oligosaccharide flippase family protein [Aeromonas caviae]